MAADVCLAEADERPAQRPAHAARLVGSCAAYRRNCEFGPRQWSRSSHSNCSPREQKSTTQGRIATLGAPDAREPVRSWANIPGEIVAPAATTGDREQGGAATGEAGRWGGASKRIRACAAGHGQPAVVPALTRTQPHALTKRRAAPARAVCQTLAAVLMWGFLSVAAAKVCDVGTWFDADCNIQINAGPHGVLAMQINWTSAVAYPR
jgi:hypothetical protein